MKTPLPKPACPMSGTRQPSDLFTTEQMREYGAAEYARAIDAVTALLMLTEFQNMWLKQDVLNAVKSLGATP